MKVIDLEKRFELRSLALLGAFNVILFVGFINSSSEVSSLLFSFLACAVTMLLALLVFNSKRNLTVCRHGVHYRNLFRGFFTIGAISLSSFIVFYFSKYIGSLLSIGSGLANACQW